MLIDGRNRMSQIRTCLDAASHFHLSEDKAAALVEGQIDAIHRHWGATCKAARLTDIDRRLLASRQFLNPYCFQNLKPEHEYLAKRATAARHAGAGA